MLFSILHYVFLFNSLTILFFGGLINCVEDRLPSCIRQTFRYGKFAFEGPENRCVRTMEVPKSWFKHFYVFAFLYSLAALYLVIHAYILGWPVPDYVQKYLQFFCIESPTYDTTNFETLLGISLIFAQCARRFYETQCLQIFSSTARINLCHYIVGYVHYFGIITTTLGRAQGFVTGSIAQKVVSVHLTMKIFACLFIFIMFWCIQLACNVRLAQLRRGPDGELRRDAYLIPKGGAFRYFTCPHMTAECMMYFGLWGILHHNKVWWFILLWVWLNQMESAYLNHKWYKKTFENYPKDRWAIFPGL